MIMADIAKILKDAPQGLKLHCTMVGECELDYVNSKMIRLIHLVRDIRTSFSLDEFGRYSENGDCILFPSKDCINWDDWQYALFANNNYGLVVVDKVIGYRYLVVKVSNSIFALCDVFGNITTTVNMSNCIFADEDCTKRFFEHLRDNGYEYKDGNVIPIEKICKPEKVSRNDYKKIIEHYGVRKQLKKLSEEVYELQEAVIEYGLMPCEENKGNVVEEMADVMVLLKQFADWFEITPENIAEIMLNKVDRTLERIKEEKNENEQ